MGTQTCILIWNTANCKWWLNSLYTVPTTNTVMYCCSTFIYLPTDYFQGRQRSPNPCFIPQMPATAQWPGLSQVEARSPALHLSLPHRWHGPKHLSCHFWPHRHISNKLNWKQRQILIPGTLLQDVGTPSSTLTGRATMLAQRLFKAGRQKQLFTWGSCTISNQILIQSQGAQKAGGEISKPFKEKVCPLITPYPTNTVSKKDAEIKEHSHRQNQKMSCSQICLTRNTKASPSGLKWKCGKE